MTDSEIECRYCGVPLETEPNCCEKCWSFIEWSRSQRGTAPKLNLDRDPETDRKAKEKRRAKAKQAKKAKRKNRKKNKKR